MHLITLSQLAIILATHRMIESKEDLELWQMIKQATIDFCKKDPSSFDSTEQF